MYKLIIIINGSLPAGMYLYLRAGWAGLFYWVKDNLNLAGILQENKDLDKFCSCKARKAE